MKAFPDDRQKDRIKKDVDRLFFVGIGIFLGYLAFPHFELKRLSELNEWQLWLGIVLVLGTFFMALYWIEEKINNRKVWWTLGIAAWLGTFTLALSGYHLQ